MNSRLTALFLGGALAIGIGTLAAPAQLILKQTPAIATPPITPPVPATRPANSLSPHPQVNYAVTQTLDVGGDGLWTHITLDPAGKFLYIPRATHTQVIDTATGKVAADIGPAKGAHDIALAPDLNRGFITNSIDGTLTLFDLKTNAILGTVNVGQVPTAIVYDPPSKRVLVACSPNTVVPVAADIDPKTGKADAPIEFDGAVQSMVSDGQGMVYATVQDKDEIAVLDTRVMKIPITWPMGQWHGPFGVCMDRAHSRLFISYRMNVAVMSAVDGHMMAEIVVRPGESWHYPNGMAAYDDGHVFSVCGDGTLSILGQNADGQFEVHQMLPLEANAHPLAIDPHTGKIYLPAAKIEKGKLVPGSFKILVVEKKQP